MCEVRGEGSIGAVSWTLHKGGLRQELSQGVWDSLAFRVHEKPEPLLLCASEGFELAKTMGRSDGGSKISREGKDKDSRKNRRESMLQESLQAKWEGQSSPWRRRNPTNGFPLGNSTGITGGECREHEEGHLCLKWGAESIDSSGGEWQHSEVMTGRSQVHRRPWGQTLSHKRKGHQGSPTEKH